MKTKQLTKSESEGQQPVADRLSALSEPLADSPLGRCLLNPSTWEGKGDVDVVTVPYVFQYLTNELAAMNIKTQLKLKASDS